MALTEKQIELCKKLKNLSDRGFAGEADNAEALLRKIMDKYGITEQMIEDEQPTLFEYNFADYAQHRLLAQVIYAVTGKLARRVVIKKTGRRLPRKLGCFCTPSENIEIIAMYSFYKPVIEAQLDTFFTAFCDKYDLYPPDEIDQVFSAADKEPDAQKTQERLKAHLMAAGMDDVFYRRQLADGGV